MGQAHASSRLWVLTAVLHGFAWGGPPAIASDASTPATNPPSVEQPQLTPDEAVARLIPQGNRPEGEELDAVGKVIESAAAGDPKNARWQYGLALLNRARCDAATDPAVRKPFAEAFKKHAAAAVKLDPKKADYYQEYGQSFMYSIDNKNDGFMTMANKAGSAKDQWEKGIEVDPNHVSCRIALARYEIQARKQGGMLFGSYKAAKKHAEVLLKNPAGEFQGRVLLAQIAAEQEEWDEMNKQYAAAEKLASSGAAGANLPELLMNQANALLTVKKDAKAAMPIIDRYMASAPESFTAYYFRGLAKKLEGDCAGAVPDFLIVLDKNADAANTRYALAECYETIGDPQSALMHYQEFTKRFPQQPRTEAANKAIKRIQKQSKK